MLSQEQTQRGISLLIAVLIGLATLPRPAQTQVGGQTGGAAEEWLNQLSGLETGRDLDVAVLRQQALERVKSKADAAPIRRPPITAQLLKLPQIVADIRFDPDDPLIRPESYRTIGRLADTLSHPTLLAYKFLILSHGVSTGKREYNLTLSQRRADAIREVLVSTFRISPKRLLALGLGEEQLLDNVHPTALVNQRLQVATVGKVP